MSAVFEQRIGRPAGPAAVAQPAALHLVYLGAIDLRVCQLAATRGYELRPVSRIDAFVTGKVKRNGPVLLDAGSAHAHGLELLRGMIAYRHGARVVMLCEQGSIGFFRQCFQAGALDVLDKSFDDDYIMAALELAAADECPHAPPAGLRQTRSARFALLSAREKDVFACLLAGHTSRDIAALLGLSSRTVELHRAHLRDKLQVRNCAQMASEYGFLCPA